MCQKLKEGFKSEAVCDEGDILRKINLKASIKV